MDNSSEWWVWSKDRHTTRPPGMGLDPCLYNIHRQMLYTPYEHQSRGEQATQHQLRSYEYQPISEEKAVLIIIQNGFKL